MFNNNVFLNQVSIFFTRGLSLKTVLSSLLIVVLFLFYVLTFASYFEPEVVVFIDRVTYSTNFENKYISGPILDTLIISTCITLVLSFGVNQKKVALVLIIIYAALALSITLSYSLSEIQVLNIILVPILIIFSIYDVIFRKNTRLLNLEPALIKNYFSI